MWKKKRYLFFGYFLISCLEANIWNVNTNGTWETGANWTTGVVPNSSTLTVTFGNAISADRTVSINTSNQVQRLVFDSPFSYTLASTGGSLTVGDIITFTSGSHTIATDMTFGPTMTIRQNSTQSSFFTGNITATNLVFEGTANRSIELVFSGAINISTSITIDNNTTVRLNPSSSISNVPISCINAGGLATTGNRTLPNDIIMQAGPTNLSSSLGSTLTLTGVISDNPTSTVCIFRDPGTINIPGANTLTTQITIRDDAVVIIGNDLALGTERIRLRENGTLSNTGNRTLTNTIQIFNDGAINASAGTEFTFNGIISGAGSLTLTGSGTKILNNNNTITGTVELAEGVSRMVSDSSFGTGPLVLNGGTINITADRTLSNPISVNGNSFISPGTATTLTIDGIITGAQDLNFTGNGTSILNQANTHSGTTTLTSGITAAGNDHAFGTSNISLNGGTLNNTSGDRTLNNPISLDSDSVVSTTGATTLTLNGVISGSNALNFDGPGTTVLNQPNTYAGPTTVSTGTIVADNDTAFGTSDVTLDGGNLTNNLIDRTLNNNFSVTSPSTIIPDVASTLTLNGTISGSGDITVASGGNLVLTGANTSSGAILLQNDDCSIDNNNGFGTSTVTFDGTSLTVSNPLTLNNPMVLNQDTTINPISDDLSLNGNITGSGMLSVSGTPGVRENLTLSGTNAYSGGTSLTDLTSSIVADANLGTGPLTLNSSTLNVDGTFSSTRNINVNTTTATEKSSVVVSANNVFTATGTLTGSDGFIKSGAGEFLIPGDQSGIAGTISVTEGTFTFDGLLSNASLEATGVSIITGSGSAGDTSVTDALLKGNGTYSNITMNSGTIAPGNSIGTITVTGNYIQNAGAVYEVELDSTTSDQIIVTGNATIETGAILTVLEPLGTILEGTTYDILIANNIDQLWSIVNIPTSVPLTLSLVEGNTIARLSAPTSRSFMNEFVENGNAQNTANYINAIEITKNADLQNIVMSIESDPDNLSSSLNQLHHARFGAFELINVESNYGIISTIDRHQAFFQCAKNCAERPNSVWVGLLGSTASRKQRNELRGSDNTDIGGILGYDYCFGNNVVLGISGGYLHTDLNWDKRGGNATSQKGFATVYGTYNNQRLQTMVCLMGGANFYDIHRRIAFADVDRTANSTNTGGFFSSNFGAKVDLLGTSNTIIAQGNIGYHYLYQDSFKETGANSVNLIIDPRTSHFLRSQLGLQISGTAGTNDECIRYYVGGNWVNKSLLNDDNFSAKFLSFKNDSPVLKVRSNDETINGFLAEAGFEASINSRQISLTYQGEFDNNDQNHQVQGSLRFSF